MRENDRDLKRLRTQFPAMPEAIRQMVAQEVERQTGRQAADDKKQHPGEGGRAKKQPSHISGSGGKRKTGRTVILIAAAAAVLGTAAMAGVNLGLSFFMDPVGQYGMKISVADQELETETETPDAALPGAQAPEEVPVVRIEASYIPDGMVCYDDGMKISDEDSLWKGGISMSTVAMDREGMDSSRLLASVERSEQIKVGDRDGVYVELEDYLKEDKGSPSFTRRIYVMYPEVWRILEMYVASDVTKEDALAVAEGISLVPTGETVPIDAVWTWSDDPDVMIWEPKVTANREELTVSRIGESFSAESSGKNDQGDSVNVPLAVKVTSVELSDHLDLLGDWRTSPYVEDFWKEAADDTGALMPDEIRYVKEGNGIDTVDQVVKTEEIGQKLVYVTVEYTNTGEETAYNVLFGACIMSLLEEGDTFSVYDRAKETMGDWDRTEQSGPARSKEMHYWDVRSEDGVNNGSNYIPSIQPGETVTIHMAWIVNEDELGYLYLDLSGAGNGIEFPSAERGARQGALLVDLRQ